MEEYGREYGREFIRFARSKFNLSSIYLEKYLEGLTVYTASRLYPRALTPYIIEERPLNVAVMDVFSRLMMDRIIFLGEPITDFVANVVQAQLLFLESVDPTRDIFIYINSPGGAVYPGLGIYDTMQYVQPDIATICTGMAASMAAILLTAGTKGKRTALPHARVMIHQPLGGVEGAAADIDIAAREILRVKRELFEILARHTGQPYEKIERDADRDYWMDASTAKEYGIIDEVLERRSPKQTEDKDSKPQKKKEANDHEDTSHKKS